MMGNGNVFRNEKVNILNSRFVAMFVINICNQIFSGLEEWNFSQRVFTCLYQPI